MAVYTFRAVPAWGQPGQFARLGLGAGKRFTVTLPGGGNATVVQDGVTQDGFLLSDANGLISDWSATDIPSVVVNFGFGELVVHSLEAISAGASSAAAAAASATSAATSETNAAASASDAASSATEFVKQPQKLTVHPTSGQGDYTSLSAALAAASTGDEVFLKAATHNLGTNTTVNVPAGVTLRASKAGATLTGVWDTTVSAIALGDGARVKGLTLTNTSPTGGTFGASVPVGIAATSRSDVQIRDTKVTGTFSQGLLLNGVENALIHGCTIDAVALSSGSTPGDGINVYASEAVTITGCTFKDLKQDGVYVNQACKSVTVTGNTFERCGEGVQVRASCESVVVTGNTFNIKATSGVISFGVVVQLDSVDCVVSDNTFRTTTGTGTPAYAVSVDTRSHRSVVANNTVKGVFAKGIAVVTTGAAGTESTGCVVLGNTLNAITGFAIHVGASENGAQIVGNRIKGGNDKAINAQCSYSTISANTVDGNGGFDGITVGGNFNAVTGNSVKSVGANAGILLSGSDNTATGNTCTANNTYGINSTGDRNVIVGNSVTGNSHATADIASSGASDKVAYNIGRYTQKGAA